MATRTYCDHCGTECVNYVATLYGGIRHMTNQHENLGGEDIRSQEFCKECMDKLSAEWGFKIMIDEMPSMDMHLEMAAERPHP